MRRFGGTFARVLDDLVRDRIGLAPSRQHTEAKERALGRAMERAGVTDEAVYLSLLQRDDAVFDDLIADLTVPETYFFRDPPHYELLRREVLPALLRRRSPRHVFELWSAGCASGEEPYSLAVLLECEGLGARANVLGTDVSRRALARARRAHYGQWSLRATSDAQRSRYFERVGPEFRLVPRLREKVRFMRHSLSTTPYPAPASRPSGFDLILCRNVLIYLDPPTVARVGQQLTRSLAEHGWLMLGPSDPLLEVEEWCDRIATPCGILYRRRAGTRSLEQHKRRHTQISWLPPSLPPLRVPTHRPRPQPVEPASPAVEPTDDAPALTAQVEQLAREHGLQVAEAGCRDLLARHPLLAPLHFLHASLLYELDRADDAGTALRRALYLDRSLLVAHMLGATLAERREEYEAARRGYEALAQAAATQPAEQPVPYGGGLDHGALAGLAAQRARALREEST